MIGLVETGNNTNRNYDSEFCGSLPIHVINHIQPYGALLVADSNSLAIVQASENIVQVFNRTADSIVNTPLGRYLSESLINGIKERITSRIIEKVPGVWTIEGKSFVTTEHLNGRLLIVEIDLQEYNEASQRSFVNVYKDIKYSMGLFQSSRSVKEVAEHCAAEVKRISGFDKVMVYRFDRDWNGTVIAEAAEPNMDSYLGITFPASDVPQQARQLYLKNPYRLIPDRNSVPVRLFPVINPVTNTFLDLSDCNLRSVAAVHIEYLKNMDVVASMSTRLLFGDTLWGLIACHHRTARMLSFELRAVFEMLSSMISARITSLINSEAIAAGNIAREKYKGIVEHIYREHNLADALLHRHPGVMSLFEASGAVVTQGGKIFSAGSVPDRDQLRELLLWLHARQLRQVFSSDCLSREYEQSLLFTDSSSGILVIPINFEQDEYVIIFRPEVVREINWGGNPEERIRFEPGSRGTYHPRNSFKKWQEHVKGCSKPWTADEVAVAESLRSFIYEFSN